MCVLQFILAKLKWPWILEKKNKQILLLIYQSEHLDEITRTHTDVIVIVIHHCAITLALICWYHFCRTPEISFDHHISISIHPIYHHHIILMCSWHIIII